jgi:hypothetical protein
MIRFVAILAGLSCVYGQNTLSQAESKAGWKLLFDGKSLDNWMWSLDPNPPAPRWAAQEGTIRTTPGQGKQVYLFTRESFSDFEFSFEWKVEPGANSGIKYRVQGYWVRMPGAPAEGPPPGPGLSEVAAKPAGAGRIEPIALEYQLIDDERHPDALRGAIHSTASLYEYWPPKKDGPAKADVWHQSRIVARGLHIEHWLDGRKVVDIELDSPEVQAAFAGSGRNRSSPLLAKQERRDSPIGLQFHDHVVEFRNLKIRRLP